MKRYWIFFWIQSFILIFTLESNNSLLFIFKQFSISNFNPYWNRKLSVFTGLIKIFLYIENWEQILIMQSIGNLFLYCVLRSQYFICKKVEAFHLIVRHKIWHLPNCEIQRSRYWLTYHLYLESICNHLSYYFFSIPARKFIFILVINQTFSYSFQWLLNY